MIFEICADSYVAALIAEKYGVKRIELCSGLSVGGLTPSLGLVKKCVSVSSVETHVMIRHREGDFVYSDDDIKIMSQDVINVANAGAAGVVFGCLTNEKKIDVSKSKFLLEFAKERGLVVTFHRAFDQSKDPIEALDNLMDMGFDRLLTSGQQEYAIDGVALLKSLVQHSSARIEIMAGSGVDVTNAHRIAETGVAALHFTIRDKEMSVSKDRGIGFIGRINEQKVASIVSLFDD